ncbi:MAG: response regulator [Candidatus Sumerlaeaceae bacterium]|nr:response regulator [Candidatus Sumerlaeaceae bacterium]
MQSFPSIAEKHPERRILVIDDESQLAHTVKSLLTTSGYDVQVAFGGREGLRKLDEEDFQLVITDLRMNDVDGFEVMRSLHERPYIEFIVITGHASTESAIEAIHYKAFDFLTKPFDFEILRATVARAFAKIETDKFRDDMISMITHDIKIPLSSIIGYSSIVFDKKTGQLNPRAQEFVNTISSNGAKILALIDNFLTSCKIEAGKLVIGSNPVNIHYLIDDLMSVFQFEIERNQLSLKTDLCEEVPLVLGEENLLFRAVSNLLSNAVKFSPRGGKITLQTQVLESDESPLEQRSLLIKVSNTGAGIPEEDLPKIFEKFRRGHSEHGIEGSGIGSYVLKYVVEAHGGMVQVHSVPNALTSFSIFLPVQPSDSALEASPER